MNKHNIILISDTTDVLTMQKSLGLYKVAYELRTAGFDVAVINHAHIFSFQEICDLLTKLVNDSTLFVGFNNIFYQYINPTTTENGAVHFNEIAPGAMLPHGPEYNTKLKAHIKLLNPDCKLVLGGPTAHDAPYNSYFDYIVSGYADISAVNLAQHLADPSVVLNKKHKSIYGPVVINDSRAEDFDFAASAMRFSKQDAIMPGEVLPLEMARGCIFKCTFCSYPLNGKKKLDFLKSEQSVYEEFVSNYQQFGVTKYLMVDDTFNDSIEKCEMIYNISKRLPFKLEYWAYIRLDLMAAHPETMDWLFDSGLKGCFFGIETFNLDTGKLIGKGGSRNKLSKTLRDIKAKWADVMLHGSFIFGLPHESLESMQETVDFLLSDNSPLDSWHLKPLRIKANSDNWTSGFLSDLDIDFAKFGYEKLGEHNLDMLWANEHTTFEQVKQMVKDAHHHAEVTGKRVISSSYAFQLAGLGYELAHVTNKTIKDFDWHSITLRKQQRAEEYKDTLYKYLELGPRV